MAAFRGFNRPKKTAVVILDHPPQPFVAVMGVGGAVLGKISAVVGAVIKR